MHTRPATLGAVIALLAAPACTQQSQEEAEADPGLPSTDIHIAELDWQDGLPHAGAPANATSRPGYDNQPAFTADGAHFYFAAGADKHTDIWRCSLDCSQRVQITDTPDAGEYSPRPTPSGGIISYIYQPPGGYGGQVWYNDPDGGNARPASERGPNGYYAFNFDMTRLAVFALTDPVSLVVFDRFQDAAETVVAEGIGRALHAAPDHDSIYFTLPREDGGFAVHHTGFAGEPARRLFDLPGQTQDYAVFALPDGQTGFVAVSEGVLHFRTEAADWQATTDLSAHGLTNITRLAVSPDRTHLAIVAEE